MKKFHLHRFSINERDRESGKKPLHYMRRFWTLYRMPEEREVANAHLETIIRPENRSAIQFSVGNAGSENPLKGHVIIFGCGYYWGLNFKGLGMFVHRFTTSEAHEYDRKDICFRLGDGHFWWKLWSSSDRWSSDTPKWRDGNIVLNPLDHIYGPKRYYYEDIASFDTTVDMVEASYPVTITLQEQTLKRAKGRVISQSHVLDVESKRGVPSHYDKSGGWKGDRVFGFGVDFDRGPVSEWHIDAKAAVEAWVLKERARTGFREPQESESEVQHKELLRSVMLDKEALSPEKIQARIAEGRKLIEQMTEKPNE